MDHVAGQYTEYHPRWLRPHLSTYWWLEKRSYFAFILREVSSVFVAWAVVYLLMIVYATSQGAAAYAELLAWSTQPPVLALNILSLLLVGFHAITWFNLAPQALVVHLGHRHVADRMIAGSNYAAWVVVSAIIAWALIARQ